MEVGFPGAEANLDADLLIQRMTDEQNCLNVEYKLKSRLSTNEMKMRLYHYMDIVHPDLVQAIFNPPANCEFLPRSLVEFATFDLECKDHDQDVTKLQKLLETCDLKMVYYPMLNRGAIPFMLEELRDDLGIISEKMGYAEMNNLKFISICEKGIALEKQTFDEEGNPREAVNSVPEALRKGIVFAYRGPYMFLLGQLKDIAQRIQVLKGRMSSVKNRLDEYFMKHLERSKYSEEEPNEKADDNTPVKKMRL